jgi:SAM-dependent methyltransferase
MDAGRFASAADAYDHHVGRYGAQLAGGLVDVVDVRRGHRVLDVGCGPGPLTSALADRAGAGAFGTRRRCRCLRAFWDAALAVAPERAGAIDDGRRVGYERPEELGDLWQARGLADVSTGELSVRADYTSFDDLFQPFTAGTGHSGACYASLDRADQRRLRAETSHRLGEPAGAFTLTARAWWAPGTVPERGAR